MGGQVGSWEVKLAGPSGESSDSTSRLHTQAYIFLIYLTPVNWIPAPEELFYATPSKKDKVPLPDISADPTTLALSVIVPAFNETSRLEKMLIEAVDYLETVDVAEPAGETSLLPKGVAPGSYEILVIDDGSSDDTTAFALSVAAKLAKQYKAARGTVKVVELFQNRGKGGATKFGVLRASGYRVLWADADGASKFSCLGQLQAELDGLERAQKAAALTSVVSDAAVSPKGEYIDLGDAKRAELLHSVTEGWQGGHGLVVGSRAHLVGTEQVAKVSFRATLETRGASLAASSPAADPPRPPARPPLSFGVVLLTPQPLWLDDDLQRSFVRNLLMRAFHSYLFLMGITQVRDTQCGFKLHSRLTAAHIYPLLHSNGWIFDCELLLLCGMARIPVSEVGIEWREVDGSKLRIAADSVRMAADLLCVRGNYLLRRWARPARVPSWAGARPRSLAQKKRQ